jgi:glycosyltransferase involved in cell wall biosynthesis
MRIALVHDLPSGGAIRSVAGQARGLAGRHRVDLYTLSTAERDLEDVTRACDSHRVYEFAPSPALARPFGMFNPLARMRDLDRLDRIWARVARDIDGSRPDVVLAHPCQFTQAPLVLRHVATPALYYCHEAPRALHERPYAAPVVDARSGSPAPSLATRLRRLRSVPLEQALRRKLTRLDAECCRRARLVATNSCFTRESIWRIYGLWARVAYHGVDPDLFSPGPAPAAPGGRGGASGAAPGYVLSVGARAPLKGFDLIVDALGLLPPEGRPGLVVVSDRAEEPAGRLVARAREASVDLAVEERVPDGALVERYRGALLTACAPVMEPFGLVPLESMACATPVVAVREGGLRETVVDGVTGLLCDRDPEELAGTVGELIGDERRREAMGRAGRAHVVEHWTWGRAVDRLERLLAMAAGRGGDRVATPDRTR